MSEFLTYEHDSGEVVFVRRNAIDSFHPRYVHPKGYTIYAVVGDQEKPVHKCKSKEEARDWCLKQIEIIGGKSDKRVS